MKKIYLSLVVLLLLAAAGCTPPSQPTPEVEKKVEMAIWTAAETASNVGLNLLDKKDHLVAVKTAQEVKKAISEVVLPYLNGDAANVASYAVDVLLQQKFFDKLDDNVRTIIMAATAVLDAYVSPPDPNTKLTPTEIAYMKAFFQGLEASTDSFTSRPAGVRPSQKKLGKWFVKR